MNPNGTQPESRERSPAPRVDGGRQSPIDLTAAAEARCHDLALSYVSSPLEVVNNGYTAQVNVATGSVLVSGNREYALQQFHFHRPSEHTVGGKAAAMEMHLVHLDAAGSIAVAGVFLNAGRRHEALERVWASIPAAKGERLLAAGPDFSAADLLPADRSYYSYIGSLTTPPYTEGVLWFVLTEPIEVSQAQLDRFAALFPSNARPLQPLNGREIYFSRAAK